MQRAIFGALAKRPVEPEVLDSYALPAVTSGDVRRDLARFMAGLDKRHTLEAAERLPAFDKPAVIAWSREDRFFPSDHGERLAELLPQGRLEWIEDSRTFSPEDQPARVAELVGEPQRGRRGAMMRYAFRPSPSRSRSSDCIGSSPVSSFTRSSR